MSVLFGLQPSIDVTNERVREYPPGCPYRSSLAEAIVQMRRTRVDLPCVIEGKDVLTGRTENLVEPHARGHVLGNGHIGGPSEIEAAKAAAKRAWHDWSQTAWEDRARIFLKAAELIAGPWRDKLNAATMLGQSKTVHQAEIDAAAELVDYLRYNVLFMQRIYSEQPISPPGVWNRMDYRPLEGFVYAVSPFNFTAIAGNLACAPALMGNTVVWKPSATARLSANLIMTILRQAGLPPGVINLVHADPVEASKIILSDHALAGIHFTGSTAVFDMILNTVSSGRYRNYPRVVGETGGKNFTLAHPSADCEALVAAIIRGAFEYQGQKCSATSRLFVPKSLWRELRDSLIAEIDTIQIGDVADMGNFMGAVIDEKAWRRLDNVINKARRSSIETVLTCGVADMTEGYFIPPTLVEANSPNSWLMKDELFGPIVTAYVYEDTAFEEILTWIDHNSIYGLTGSIFAHDSASVRQALSKLRYAAGNIYINDKSTGAVVGQQPFGGGRASGTNDKAGSLWNLSRWVSPRTIKESFLSATDYRYPYMS